MADEQTKRPVFCIRNHTSKDADEHLACPYCFGRKREVIEQGERKDFCDFDPERDPAVFGFPTDTTRNAGS